MSDGPLMGGPFKPDGLIDPTMEPAYQVVDSPAYRAIWQSRPPVEMFQPARSRRPTR